MKSIAFLTMGDLGIHHCDDDLAQAPLARLGWAVSSVSWHEPPEDWGRYGAVIVRSTWDYQHHPRAFWALLESIQARGVVLENPLDLMGWNMDKTYLRELETLGIGIVPTLWGRGDPLGCYGEFCVKLGEEKLVIKPRVSASAEDTFVIGCDRDLDRVARLFRNREWMVQAFMGAVIDEGEFSLFYFNGVLSHVVLKQPHPGDFRVQEEYGGQTLWVKDVEPDLVTAGQGVMNGLDASPLYARVDMVRGDGEFLLMELELIEPSLFLSVDPGAPERFARAIDHRLGNL